MLKKILNTCIIGILAFNSTVSGQTFSIDEVNTGTYPSVTLKISQQDKKKIQQTDITVNENNQKVDFTLIPIENNSSPEVSNKKAVCILIENSGFVSLSQITAVKSAIKSVLNKLDNNYVADICYYNDTKQTGTVSHVSTEFTGDFQSLIKDMNTRVAWAKNDKPNVDLYKALYECIEFVTNKTSLPDNKQIILISTGNNNGTSPIKLSDCVEKAKNTSIAVNGIGLKSADNNASDNIKLACSDMKGRYEMDNNTTDIATAIEKYIKNVAPTEKKAEEPQNGFYLKYTSPQKGSINPVTIKVVINGIEKTTTYQAVAPPKNNSQIFTIIGICAIIVMACIAIAVLISNKKKKVKQEEERIKREEEKARERAAELLKSNTPEMKTSVVNNENKTQFIAQPPVANDPRKTTVAGIKMAKLKNLNNKTYNLTEMIMSIGRKEDNQIVIHDATVSGKHAIISNENGKWYISDQNSTNGLFVNGQRVTKTELFTGMILTFGQINCEFEIS